MPDQILPSGRDGPIAPMYEEPLDLGVEFQELVARYPGLLSGEQMNPDYPRRFILIGREMGIADARGSGHRLVLDHLMIDQDAIPTLVEVKQPGTSPIQQEIIGQLLYYAAHAVQTWNVADLRRAFEDCAEDPYVELANLLGEEPNADKFWDAVETNLRGPRYASC